MRIALEGNDQKPVAVHESWHSIEEDLDEAEIAVLRRERERLRKVAGRYLGADASNLSEQEVYANAAEAYWVKGQKQGIHIEVRRIFDRIREMLRRMRNYLHGEGYRTTEDIFKAFTEGEIAERGPTEGGGLEAETGEQLAAPRRAEKPVFYSALLQATETVPMKQGDAAQWMNALKKQPGVTKEEMDWLGLEDWLKERKGKISKSDVVDFVRSNQVQVEETLRGGGRGDYQVPLIWEGLQPPRGSRSFTRADSLTFEHDGDEFVYEVYRSNKAGEERTEIWTDESQILADDYHISDEEVEQAIRLHLSEFRDLEGVQRGGTKFAQYQGREGVRGDEGKNYGELLLTLPEEPQPVAVYKDDKLVGEFPSWTAARRVWENEHEAGLVVIRDIGKSRDNFTEGHFEEPNVLAHVRFNERESEDIDPDTEKARKARQDLSTEYRRASMALHQERLEAGRNVQRAAVRGEISADEAQRRMRDLDYPESELPSLARVKELSDQLRSAGFSPPPKEPKRILFLEEVQSDWGQKLRRERKKVKEAINRDFDGIAAKMVEAGLIQKDCD
jgi:hypothetical protein